MGDTVMMQKRQRQKKFVGGIIKKGVQKIIKKVTDKVKKPKKTTKPKTGVTTKGPANPGARSRRGGNIGKTAIVPPVVAGGVLGFKKPKKRQAPSITRTAHGPLKGGSPTPGPKKKRKPTPAGDFVRFSNPRKSGFVRDSKGNKIRTGKNTKAYKKRMQDRKMGGGK